MSPKTLTLAPSHVLGRLRILGRFAVYVTTPRMTKADWDEYPARITYYIHAHEEEEQAA